MIRALIFDFDGLILDTETPHYQVWCNIYGEYGCELPLDRYLNIIGSSAENGGFVPFDVLLELTGAELARAPLEERARRERLARIDAQAALPGVEQHLAAAEARGLKLGLASSSSRAWVERHLRRLGLLGRFDAIRTADDVEWIKPAPDLFEVVLDALGVRPGEAVVYEDSAHGIEAASAVGIFTVAVPNFLTRYTDLSGADLRVESLADVSLDEVMQHIANGKKRHTG